MALFNPIDQTAEPAVNVLAQHGKSFRFAGRFLGRQQLKDCARLYRFCRFVDDLVDESANPVFVKAQLQRIEQDIKRGQSHDPVLQDFIDLSTAYKMDQAVINELVKGIASDLDGVLIQDTARLLKYCYRVAGTVGLLMCDILGVSDEKARAHAIDLGIAMQLTNIARDVKEDAAMGRRYIPADWIGAISPRLITEPDMLLSCTLSSGVKRLLAMAECYYRSGQQGLKYLPSRARLAIAIAANVYREIGNIIREMDFDIWSGRARVSFFRKVRVAIGTTFGQFRSSSYVPHDHKLHTLLAGLPHVNESNI
ncbi:MAG: phytoene synthase [Pseudohongiellaceae bacterium]|jgi:phytoene synthase